MARNGKFDRRRVRKCRIFDLSRHGPWRRDALYRFAVQALMGMVLSVFATSQGWGGTVSPDRKTCGMPPYMDDAGVYESGHHHPKVRVLLYKRNPDLTASVHYPLQFLQPAPGLGIDNKKKLEPSGSAADERTYRQIHVHDDGWGKLHVEENEFRPYRLCDLIGLWLASSPSFRKIWRNSTAAGAHIWIDGYHLPYVRLEKLLQIPLDHEFTITICIEESVPV